MPKFLLFLHEDPNVFAPMSAEEMQRIIQVYRAWKEGLMAQGRITDAMKLRDEGGRRVVRRSGELVVTDGPYLEVKDVVGGVFVVDADSYDHAVELASGCPHLDYGEIEVREVDTYRAPS